MGIMNHEIMNYFLFNGIPLPYNKIPYNNPSERSVEIPIAIRFLRENASGKKILEIGNVLSNYRPLLAHPEIGDMDIIDKFEVSPGVLNVDLMDYDVKHDIIVSVSTVEHVGQKGYGEFGAGDREAPLRAITKIYNLLNCGGKALITVPFGKLTDLGWLIQFSAEYLDLLVKKYGIPPSAVKVYFMKKLDMEVRTEVPAQNWIQCSDIDLKDADFHSPFFCANGITIIQLEKSGSDLPLVPRKPDNLSYSLPVVIGDLYYSPFIKTLPNDPNGWFYVPNAGFIFYGPYLTMTPHSYQLDCSFEIIGTGHFTLDFTSNAGNKVLWKQDIVHSAEVRQTFLLNETEANVEIRLYKHNHSECWVRVPKLSFYYS